MSRRSRRGKKSKPSRRNLFVSIGVLVLIVVSIGGFYAYQVAAKAPISSSTTSSSSSGTASTSSNQYAVLDTSQGVIVVQLYPTISPQTVSNFVGLAQSGFYSNLVWHRIVKGFIIQTGDPTTRNGGGNESNWGSGGSSTDIPFENNALPNNEGFVAMANTSPGGNGASSQFFIDLANNTSLTGQYTVFGKVVQGLNVALAIGSLPVNVNCTSSGDTQCQPQEPSQAMLLSVTIQDNP